MCAVAPELRMAVDGGEQAYETLHSKEGQGEAPGPSAPQGPVNFASEIAHEVANLKDRKGQLLTYHRTGVSALVYLEMRQDAGAR